MGKGSGMLQAESKFVCLSVSLQVSASPLLTQQEERQEKLSNWADRPQSLAGRAADDAGGCPQHDRWPDLYSPAVLWARFSSKPPHALKHSAITSAAVLQQMIIIFFKKTFTNSTSSYITLNLLAGETLQLYQALTKFLHLYVHKCTHISSCPGLSIDLQLHFCVHWNDWSMDSGVIYTCTVVQLVWPTPYSVL